MKMTTLGCFFDDIDMPHNNDSWRSHSDVANGRQSGRKTVQKTERTLSGRLFVDASLYGTKLLAIVVTMQRSRHCPSLFLFFLGPYWIVDCTQVVKQTDKDDDGKQKLVSADFSLLSLFLFFASRFITRDLSFSLFSGQKLTFFFLLLLLLPDCQHTTPVGIIQLLTQFLLPSAVPPTNLPELVKIQGKTTTTTKEREKKKRKKKRKCL